MFRNIGIRAAAVLAVGALAIGCSDDGDTVISGGLLTTDNFPGSQVQENNVADDGRAASNQGQDYNIDGELFWNVTTGEAIGLYTADAANDGSTILYAVYFNGSSWGRPVQIVGRDAVSGDVQDPFDDVDGFKVCWINTSSTSGGDANVAARDGDAVILFTRDDLDPLGNVATEEDANTRLWLTYFDKSAASLPAANGVQGGFTTDAITVDTDNLITTFGDPDVSDFGFVSDSLEKSHEFGSGTDQVDSGQPTNFLAIVYRKDIGSGTTVGQRWLSRSIIGDAADNDLDSLLDAQETLPVATNALATNENVGSGFTVHNDLMYSRHTTVVLGDTETIVTVTQFDADGVADQVALGQAVIDNDEADTVFVPAAEDVYGPDHGLASTYAFFSQSGYRTDNTLTDGDAASDVDLFVSQIDNDATSLANEIVKIDNFADTITAAAAGTAGRTGRNISNVQTRMGRTGEYITVLFNQENTDATTDTVPTAINTNNVLYVTVVQTRVIDPSGTTAARALDDSVFDATAGGNFDALRAPSLLASGTAVGGIEGPVQNADFQVELLNGASTSQNDDSILAHERNCVIQSDAYRMNFVYTQLADGVGSGGTGIDEERLLVNGVSVTLDTTGTATPDLDLVDATEELVATRDTDWGPGFDAIAADAGDVTRDATTGLPSGDSGRVLVVYLLNGNNPADDTVAASFFEQRAFVYDSGSSELLSTDGDREFDQVTDLLAVETVPASATTTHHAGTTLHLIWAEAVENDDGDNGQGMAIMTRSYDKGAINDGATTNDTLENRFTPNLVGGTAAADPVQIDSPVEGDLMDTDFGNDDFTVAVAGTTVGVYFTEDEHLYYNDTASDALGWDRENGISAPQLVDNDSPTGTRVVGVQMFFPPECDNLTKSQAFFVRDDTTQQGFNLSSALRFYLRIHN